MNFLLDMKMKEIFLSFVSLFASLAFVVLFIFIGKYLRPDLYLFCQLNGLIFGRAQTIPGYGLHFHLLC